MNNTIEAGLGEKMLGSQHNTKLGKKIPCRGKWAEIFPDFVFFFARSVQYRSTNHDVALARVGLSIHSHQWGCLAGCVYAGEKNGLWKLMRVDHRGRGGLGSGGK